MPKVPPQVFSERVLNALQVQGVLYPNAVALVAKYQMFIWKQSRTENANPLITAKKIMECPS